MTENGLGENRLERKEKIRKRYGQIQQDKVQVIPAKPVRSIYEKENVLRVGIYARVSTESTNQTTSYELQKTYYEDMVRRNPNWELVGIYADEGISGTSLNHRDEFMRLIEDCMAGKIDLIVTKSVSRFARNLEDCIHYVKMLTNKRPATGILFESEGLYTLNENIEMSLAMNATMAQEESHIKSVGMNRSVDMRFSIGIFLIPVLLGYDHDEDGNLIINREEAKTVRLIFLMYLCGYSCREIADEMTRLNRRTKIGNFVWAAASVRGILQNERHCGDILARKTYTPSYLDHKSVKNRNERTQYYVEDDHEAIVSREMYRMVQMKLEQSKYGFRNVTPELKVIREGALRGFVQINPCWMGFAAEDYLHACRSVLADADYSNPVIKIKKNKGDYDFREYQVTRSQFVPTTQKISMSLNTQFVKCSSDAVRTLPRASYVEIFCHPLYQMVVVRASSGRNKHAVKWMEYVNGKKRPRKIRGKAFMPILYELMGWNHEYRYTLTGIEKVQGDKTVLLFYAGEPEIRIYDKEKLTVAYQEEWAEKFGDTYLVHAAREQMMFVEGEDWRLGAAGVIANESMVPVLPKREIREEMERLKGELEAEVSDGRQKWI